MRINLEIKSEQNNKRFILNKKKMKEIFKVPQFFSLISLPYNQKIYSSINVRNLYSTHHYFRLLLSIPKIFNRNISFAISSVLKGIPKQQTAIFPYHFYQFLYNINIFCILTPLAEPFFLHRISFRFCPRNFFFRNSPD